MHSYHVGTHVCVGNCMCCVWAMLHCFYKGGGTSLKGGLWIFLLSGTHRSFCSMHLRPREKRQVYWMIMGLARFGSVPEPDFDIHCHMLLISPLTQGSGS